MVRSDRTTGTDTVAFASLLSGAYASAAVALLFLVIDAVRGDPFFTPSLMGSMLLLGSTPSPELPVRADMVAYYSLIHVAAFALIGTGFTLACLRFDGLARGLLIFPAAVFATLTLGAACLDAVLFPGLVGAIGLAPLVAANLSAAVVMSTFIRGSLDSAEGQDMAASAIQAPSRTT